MIVTRQPAWKSRARALSLEIALRVREVRTDLGVGQKPLERAAGLTRGILSRLERGQRAIMISAYSVIALAEALEVDPGWLLTGEGKPRRHRSSR